MNSPLDAETSATARIFVYGTLLLPEISEVVIGRMPPSRAATLPGYASFLMRGECFPGLVADAASETSGLVFDDIRPGEWQRLDEYEGEMYALVPVPVVLGSGALADARVYVLRSEHLDQLTDMPWDFKRFAVEEAEAFLEFLRADGSSKSDLSA